MFTFGCYNNQNSVSGPVRLIVVATKITELVLNPETCQNDDTVNPLSSASLE